MAEVHRQIQNQLEEMVSPSLPVQPLGREGQMQVSRCCQRRGEEPGMCSGHASTREVCAFLWSYPERWGRPQGPREKSHTRDVTTMGAEDIQMDLEEKDTGKMGCYAQLAAGPGGHTSSGGLGKHRCTEPIGPARTQQVHGSCQLVPVLPASTGEQGQWGGGLCLPKGSGASVPVEGRASVQCSLPGPPGSAGPTCPCGVIGSWIRQAPLSHWGAQRPGCHDRGDRAPSPGAATHRS